MSRDLVAAIRARDRESVRRLLASGANANASGWWNESPLEVAAETAQHRIAADLLDAGALPNGSRLRRSNALAIAAHAGDIAMLELLLARGARAGRVRFQRSLSAVEAAAYGDQPECLRLLVQAGATVAEILARDLMSLMRLSVAVLEVLKAANPNDPRVRLALDQRRGATDAADRRSE